MRRTWVLLALLADNPSAAAQCRELSVVVVAASKRPSSRASEKGCRVELARSLFGLWRAFALLNIPDKNFNIREPILSVKPDTPGLETSRTSDVSASIRAWRHKLVESQATLFPRSGCLACQILVRSDLLGELMLLDAPSISRCFGGCLGTLANRLLQVV